MLIIKIESNNNGFHPFQSQSHRTSCWLEGYIAVPAEFEKTVFDCRGYCELTIEDNVLTNVTPRTDLIPQKTTIAESLPTAQDDTDALMVDHEYRLTLLELGVNE